MSLLISINDQLPECDHECTSSCTNISSTVLLFGKSEIGSNGHGFGHYQDDGKWVCYEGEYEQMHIVEVTHWMRLPRPTDAHSGDAQPFKLEGMLVSMDVSTGEHDALNRIYGRVNEVMLDDGGAGTILAEEESRNFAASATSQPEGMPVSQEPKYGIRDNRLYNRASGEFIPLDEPLFIFRACDVHAVGTLKDYSSRCFITAHAGAVTARVQAFQSFAVANHDRMKQPDTDSAANAGCMRSHPHEEMNAECQRKTEQARQARQTADALNTVLWLYRRLPRAYGRPPAVEQTINALAQKTGTEVAAFLAERDSPGHSDEGHQEGGAA